MIRRKPVKERPILRLSSTCSISIQERVRNALSEKWWLDTRVREVFQAYCAVYNIKPRGYRDQQGDENVNDPTFFCTNDIINIRQDQNYYNLPMEYVYLDEPDRTARMIADKAEQERQLAEATRRAKLGELYDAENKANRLRTELGLPQRPSTVSGIDDLSSNNIRTRPC